MLITEAPSDDQDGTGEVDSLLSGEDIIDDLD